MNPLRKLARRARRLFLSQSVEAEMAEEMRFHLEQRAAGYAAEGLPEAEARLAAQRRFGNLGSIREQSWEARGGRGLELFLADVRLALRQFVRAPGFAILAVVTLGLGIGANTSAFNVVKTIMLKPLPYPDAERLDRVTRATPQDREGGFSPADFLELRGSAAEYGDVAAYTSASASLSDPGRAAEMAPALRVTANLLPVLGIAPQLGRGFRQGEEVEGGDRVVILSQRLWKRRFEGRADVLGKTVRVDGEPHQVVGVLPEAFNDWRHLGWVDVFRPLPLGARDASDRSRTNLRVVGRRSGRLTIEEADALAGKLGARLAVEYPEANAGSTWHVTPLVGSVLGKDSAVMPMLVGLSGFVLLIACSNLANFLLARTMARAREFAMRAALGASRTQLLRPLLAEALVLSLGGGVVAILVALWFGQWAHTRSIGDSGEGVTFVLDWAVLGWALAVSLVTALAFASAPALFAMRLDLNQTLKSGGRGATGGRGHLRFRQVLVVGQFALAMVLLAGAALFIRGLDDLTNRRAGWESSELVTATYLLPAAAYPSDERIEAFHRRTVERLEALPRVTSVSVSSFTPFFNWGESRRFVVARLQRPPRGHEPAALVNAVTPRYFETFGTNLLAGRAFSALDGPDAPRVCVVNQAMATGLFGKESPIGQRLEPVNGQVGRTMEIVGVAADVKPTVADPVPTTFQLYVPMAQEPRRQSELAVRTSRAPAELVAAIRAAMTELDADLPVRKLQPADATIWRANYQLRVLRDMLATLGLLGLGLACLGIYGVIARLMAQRTSEFAIRLAMGATVRDITRLVLGSGIAQALAGSALGLVGALGVSRVIAAGFPGIAMNSPAILAATTLLLVGVALLACWVPARRAGRIDATLALRAE